MISINIEKSDIYLFEKIIRNYPENIDIDEVESSFNGEVMYQIILELTEAILPIIVSILIAKENKSRIISIKHHGVDITAPIKQELTFEQLKELLDGLDKSDLKNEN